MNRVEQLIDWSLRDDLLAAAHRWPLILIFCLCGAAVGAMAALLWPSPVRASRELYVGLNVTQAGEDRSAAQQSGMVFINANDYKNWQMASLNTLVFTDVIIDGTLEQLRRVNPYWASVSQDELSDMLSVYWRNAGKWRLVAEHPVQDRAIEAVVAWQDVIIGYVHEAVAQSSQALALDGQIRPLGDQLAQAWADIAAAEQRLAFLNQQIAVLAKTKEPTWAEIERQNLLAGAQAVNPAAGDLGWLGNIPPAGSQRADVLLWLDGASVTQSTERTAAQELAGKLEARYQELSAQFTTASQASLGLSSELLVQKLSRTRVDVERVRPVGVSMLVGLGMGLISWAAWFLFTAARRFAPAVPETS